MNLKFFTTVATVANCCSHHGGYRSGRRSFEVQKNAAKKIAGLHRFVDLHHRQGFEDKKNAAKKIADLYRFAANMANKKWGEADE